MLLAPREKAQLQSRREALRRLEEDFFGGKTTRQVQQTWRVPSQNYRAPKQDSFEAAARRAKALARLGIADADCEKRETRLTLWPAYKDLSDGDVLCTIQQPSNGTWRSVAQAEHLRRRLLLRVKALAVCGLELHSVRVHLVEPPSTARTASVELDDGTIHTTKPTQAETIDRPVAVQVCGVFGGHLYVDRLDGARVGDSLCGWLAARGAPLASIDEEALLEVEKEADSITRRSDARKCLKAVRALCGHRSEMRFDELREAFLYAPTDVLDPFKAGPWEDVFGGGAVISLAQLKRGLHRLLKCRRRGVGLEAPPLSVVGPPIFGGPLPAPPPADDAADDGGGVDDAEVEAHADEYADDAFDEDPSEKPGSYADDFFEVEASAG